MYADGRAAKDHNLKHVHLHECLKPSPEADRNINERAQRFVLTPSSHGLLEEQARPSTGDGYTTFFPEVTSLLEPKLRAWRSLLQNSCHDRSGHQQSHTRIAGFDHGDVLGT